MKKLCAVLLALLVTAGLLTGCGTPSAPEQTNDKLRIVTTIFPEYDWVREILGDQADRVELTMLLDNGVDLHSFQPTADDMVAISNCDLFLYTGGESDAWVEDALANAANPDRVSLNLMEVLGDRVKEEKHVEGMQEDDHHHDHDEDHDHHEDHDHDSHHHEDHQEDTHHDRHEAEEAHEHHEEDHDHADEHIWLSLKHAGTLCRAIADSLGTVDPAHRDTYQANADAYCQKLADLDRQYQAAADGAVHRTLLFADRFPFRYLTDDYGLDYYAAFSGCSAETEASFETVAFLARKTDELGLPCVLTIEGTTHGIAETVVQNTRAKTQKILVLDSMQSVTAGDVAGGTTYLSTMARNLETLKAALG